MWLVYCFTVAVILNLDLGRTSCVYSLEIVIALKIKYSLNGEMFILVLRKLKELRLYLRVFGAVWGTKKYFHLGSKFVDTSVFNFRVFLSL